MSRAFVRESDADPGPLPDRPISPRSHRHCSAREPRESVPFQGAEAEIVSIEQ